MLTHGHRLQKKKCQIQFVPPFPGWRESANCWWATNGGLFLLNFGLHASASRIARGQINACSRKALYFYSIAPSKHIWSSGININTQRRFEFSVWALVFKRRKQLIATRSISTRFPGQGVLRPHGNQPNHVPGTLWCLALNQLVSFIRISANDCSFHQ